MFVKVILVEYHITSCNDSGCRCLYNTIFPPDLWRSDLKVYVTIAITKNTVNTTSILASY